MVKELKKAFQLVQYGVSLKQQIIFCILFMVIGVVTEIFGRGSSLIGGFYLVISTMFLGQLITSVDASTLVQASPYKRKIQVLYPYIAMTPWMIVVMTIVVLIHWHFAKSGDAECYAAQSTVLLQVGIILFFTMMYMAFCYKYFWAAMLGLILVIYPVTIVTSIPKTSFANFAGQSFSRSVVCCYVLILVGITISFFINKALYKKKFSPMAFGRALRNVK